MIENWEFCNLTGVVKKIGFKVELFNCRVAAYLNQSFQRTGIPPLNLALSAKI